MKKKTESSAPYGGLGANVVCGCYTYHTTGFVSKGYTYDMTDRQVTWLLLLLEGLGTIAGFFMTFYVALTGVHIYSAVLFLTTIGLCIQFGRHSAQLF